MSRLTPGSGAPVAAHGSLTRYRKWGCRCEQCCAANTSSYHMAKLRRSARLEHDAKAIPHGRTSTYGNHGCRCESCTEAHAADVREYKARRRADRSVESAT